MSDDRTTTEGRPTVSENRDSSDESRKSDERPIASWPEAARQSSAKPSNPEDSPISEERETESVAAGAEPDPEFAETAEALSDEETQGAESAGDDAGGDRETVTERAADDVREADSAEEAGDPGSEEEIVIAEGKTLSDYLEEEPEPPKAAEPKEFRSVPNVERLVVPPPGGVLLRARQSGDQSGTPSTSRSERRVRADEAGGKPSERPAGSSAAAQGPSHTGVNASRSAPSTAPRAPAQEGAAERATARTTGGAAREEGQLSPAGATPGSTPRSGPDSASGPARSARGASAASGETEASPPSPAAQNAGGEDRPSTPSTGKPARLPVPSVQISEEGDFGAMFESSLKAKSFEDGQSVQGVVIAIGPDVAFLDIGGKSEATIDIEELKDAEGDIEVEVGETIEALVVSTEGGLKLSRKLARGAAAKEQIADAFRAGLPVEGRVEKAIKGGYEVRVAGQRAFCPISQIDTARTTDPAVHVGKVHTFRIIEFKDGGKDLILSRRVLLQEEEKAKAEEARKSIVPDAVLTGRVVSVRDYGAFVDLGGVQGLLHVSEMGWSRVSNPAEIVKPGDEITVKVLRIDEEKGRISLGLKQLQPDPWSKVAEGYSAGKIVPGRIVRIQDFGAFVELEPGVEALAHVSTFPPTGTPDGWKQNVTVGTKGMFEVLSVDTDRKRIGVAMVEEGSSRARGTRLGEPAPTTAGSEGDWEGAVAAAGKEAAAPVGRERSSGDRPGQDRVVIVPGARLNGKVERHEKYGVFIFLAPGRTGLMPAGESGTQRGTDLRKAFPVGSEIEVVVLEVDGKRIRLSRKAVLEHEEKDDAREFSERRAAPAESFGSLGEKLRAALASKQK